MNTTLAKLPATLLICCGLLTALFSCQKDPYEIGFDLLPPTDTLNVRTTDTCTVEAFSVIQDSTRSDKTANLMAGAIADPVFGKLTTGFYSQVKLSSEAVDFGEQPVLDSLVLLLYYSSLYGDSTTMLNLKVYEMSEDLVYDSIHFTNQKIATYPTLLADRNFTPRIHDSVTVWGEKTPPHLRVNLSNITHYLGNKILQAPKDAIATNAAFIKYFKGLNVAASPVSSGGSVVNFSIAAGKSRLVAYFHDAGEGGKDSLHYDMPLNQSCARFITVGHNGYLDASSDLKRQILNHDSLQGATKLFLQGLGGVQIKVKFPFIKALPQGKVIAVNDAVLRFYNMENDTVLAPPASLYFVRQDSIGRIGYLPDENEGSAYFGGTYDKKERTYFFRVTRHIQRVLQNGYSNSFDLYMMANMPVTNVATANRVMLYGTGPQDPKRMKLIVTYTVLN